MPPGASTTPCPGPAPALLSVAELPPACLFLVLIPLWCPRCNYPSRVLSASATWKPRRAPYPRLAPLHLHAAPELGAQTFTHWCFLPPLLASELLDSNLSCFSGSVSQPSQHGGSRCQKPSSFGSDCLFSSLPSLGFLKGSHTKPTARCSLRSLGLHFNRLPEDQVDGEGISSSQQPWGHPLPQNHPKHRPSTSTSCPLHPILLTLLLSPYPKY